MRTPLFRALRIIVIVQLALLVFQYELGIAINLSPLLQPMEPFAFSNQQMMQALQTVGSIGTVHAMHGAFIWLIALAVMILTFFTKKAGMIIFGSLGFLASSMAGFNGVMFTLSGFQNDGFSHGMATGFILTLIFYFILLYLLKPLPRMQPLSS